ncbi:MAG: hypothetical protein ACLUEU_01150 [Oscillospiraceae bacterium]
MTERLKAAERVAPQGVLAAAAHAKITASIYSNIDTTCSVADHHQFNRTCVLEPLRDGEKKSVSEKDV